MRNIVSTIELTNLTCIAAKAHCILQMTLLVLDAITQIQDSSIHNILKKLLDLFCLSHMYENLTVLLEGKYFEAKQAEILRQAIE